MPGQGAGTATQVERCVESLQVLAESGAVLVAAPDRQAVAEAVVEQALRLVGAEAAILLLAQQPDGLQAAAWRGLDPAALAGRRLPPVPEALLALGRELGLAHGLVAPLRAGQETIGLVGAFSRRPPAWGAGDEATLAVLAGQGATALQAADRLAGAEAARRQAEQDLAALESVARPGLANLGLDALLHELIRRIVGASHAYAGAILLVEEETQELVVRAAYGIPRIRPGRIGLRVGEGFLGGVAQSGRPATVLDAENDPGVIASYFRENHIKSALAVPLTIGPRVIGVTHIDTADIHRFSPAEVRRLLAMAEVASLALERARLLDELRHEYRLIEDLLEDRNQRVKELTAIYAVARITGERRPRPEVFAEVSRLVEGGWQYPEITRAQVIFDGQAYAARQFQPTPWRQAADIVVSGAVRGRLEVYYLEERPPADEGPFLKEERNLIDEVARSLGEMVERQELEQLQEDYISLVSHDLRSPLSVIVGQVGLMRRRLAEAPDERLEQSAGAIMAAGERMNAMIQELVDSVRLEIGHLEMRKESLSLAGLIVGLVEKGLLPPQRQRVRLALEEDLPPIALDRMQIERALTNLIGNALKYSPPESPVLVGLERTTGEAVITVRDWGPGISPQELPHLFERFYRAPSRAQTEGLGLGLYITRLIAEAHGGRVWAESEVGKGSIFYLALPLNP